MKWSQAGGEMEVQFDMLERIWQGQTHLHVHTIVCSLNNVHGGCPMRCDGLGEQTLPCLRAQTVPPRSLCVCVRARLPEISLHSAGCAGILAHSRDAVRRRACVWCRIHTLLRPALR